jgi:protease-4
MASDPRSTGRSLLAAAVIGATATVAGKRLLARLTRGRFGGGDEYNAAKVTVSGPISRDAGRPSPLSGPGGATADDVVEQIEAADEDEDVSALVVELNTPGGEVLPSDDIRRAAAGFDGPTLAYATDTCASGGYWIASGCDELWARDASLVGSIGVVGSRPNAAGLADKLGISYEQFTAGEYKDAGVPLREIEEDEREYLQGIIDGYYEQFVETVSEGRDMDPEAIRETEARVYLGTDAAEIGLVDELGTADDVEDRLEELIDAEPEIREFTPDRGLAERLGIGAERVAFAAGSGVASVFATEGGDVDVELR